MACILKYKMLSLDQGWKILRLRVVIKNIVIQYLSVIFWGSFRGKKLIYVGIYQYINPALTLRVYHRKKARIEEAL